MVVFLWSLYGNSEKMLVKTSKVACISDQYAVVVGEIVLELGGGSALNPAKEDVRIAWIDGYPVNGR